MQGPPSGEAVTDIRRDQSRPTALVHILTPEFLDLNPDDFAGIPEDQVEKASPDNLRGSLFWRYVRKDERTTQEVTTFSYMSANEGVFSVALTPAEYSATSESVDNLGKRRFAKILDRRDRKLREEQGDESALARSDEDIRVARRGAMRSVLEARASMHNLLEDGIEPKITLIEKFIEMTTGKNPNLARGNRETVRERFEELRTTVFNDMLDAVALQREWDAKKTARAKQIIQYRLYMAGSSADRVANFRGMLLLAQDYYGHKKALLLTKKREADMYIITNQDAYADMLAVDEERRREKEAKQLQFGDES